MNYTQDNQVEINKVKDSPADQSWINDVYLIYIQELAEFEPTYNRLIKWTKNQSDPLRYWFSQPNVHPLIVLSGGRRAGFAFVAQAPFPNVSPGCDYRMGEFYIHKEFRGLGLGRQAAQAIFDLFPGAWEITELPANAPAINFWRRVIGSYTSGRFEDAYAGGYQRQCFQNKVE